MGGDGGSFVGGVCEVGGGGLVVLFLLWVVVGVLVRSCFGVHSFGSVYDDRMYDDS